MPNRGFPLVKQAFLKVHRAAKKHGKVAHLGGIWTPLGTVGAKNAEKGRKKDEPETRPKKGGEKVTRCDPRDPGDPEMGGGVPLRNLPGGGGGP